MLVLSRKKGESIMIGDQIELIILGTEGDTVRVGVKAPQHIEINRKEIYLAILDSNKEASSNIVTVEDLNKMLNKGRTHQ